MRLKELAIAILLVLAHGYISRLIIMQVYAFFSVISMVQPTNQIPLYVGVIVIGLVFGILFKFLSKKFLHDLRFNHFLILSIIFVIIGSLFSYIVLFPLISFLEPTLKEVTVEEVVEKPTQPTLYYPLIVYPICFLISFNIFKRK